MDTNTITSQETLLSPPIEIKRAKVSLGRTAKRTLDILAAGAGLLVLWPVFVVVAILLRREGGPVYYRGRRLGRGGKEFKMLKFRTMYERPESYKGHRSTAGGEERGTPLGKWL